ncbi:MAG: Ig-like domain-containing protein [Gammaproteobacteria bacterium]
MTQGTVSSAGWRFSLLWLALVLSGCPSGTGDGLDDNGRPLSEGGGTPPPALNATFESLQANIFTPTCTVCHAGAAAPVGLKLDAANSYDMLVGVASAQVPAQLRVVPGDPDASYLVQKIEGTAAVGQQMPLGGPFLDSDQVAQVRDWIAAGAQPPAPPAADTPPLVQSLTPAADSTVTMLPVELRVVFSKPMDASLVSTTTVLLRASGGDGLFGDAADLTITPAGLGLDSVAANTLVIDLDGVTLPDDDYQLRLIGSGATALADTDGVLLDGNADGTAGDDFEAVFTIATTAPPPAATWRSIQDEVFTPVCVVCHVDGGQAAFLPLDETNSYDALVGVPSTEVPSLLRVEPLNANDSYLVQKLEGTAAVGAQMPLGGEPLPESTIAAVRGWIDTGAVRTPGDPVPDIVPPAVVVAAPLGVLAGTVTLAANANDASGVASVDFWIDDALLARDTVAPFEATFDTTTVADGEYAITARALDNAGNEGLSPVVNVTVDNAPPPDDQAPSVSLADPGMMIMGSITLTAAASDNVGVTLVRFFVDDQLIGTDNVAPYSLEWDSSGVTDGAHALRAQAEDAAGNVGDSTTIDVIVDNALPPDTTAPTVAVTPPAGPLTGTAVLSVTAMDDVGVVSVDLFIDDVLQATDTTAPYEFDVDTTAFADGDYVARAEAVDAASNVGVSDNVVVMIENAGPPDTVAPVVMLTAPAQPAAGTVTVQVTASDDTALASVSVLVDGVALGVDTVAPFEFVWDTTALLDGDHVLSARATDAAGNEGADEPLVVTVTNGGPQPTLPWIQREIFEVGCAAGCHIAGGIAPFLRLDAANAFADLVNVAASEGGSSLRVTPGDADDSALVQRLEGDLTPSMPLGGAALPDEDIAAVRAWIDGGAFETPPDTIAPGVSLAAITSAVSGEITLEAFAVDDVAVTEVRFVVNGTEVGGVGTMPYTLLWDSRDVVDGTYPVLARALDAAGNEGVSQTVLITIDNSTSEASRREENRP